MIKFIKLLITLTLFSIIAVIVNIAGELALSGSPLSALLPVVLLLGIIVLYILRNDKKG